MNVSATGTKANITTNIMTVLANGNENPGFNKVLELLCEDTLESLADNELSGEEEELLAAFMNLYPGVFGVNPQLFQVHNAVTGSAENSESTSEELLVEDSGKGNNQIPDDIVMINYEKVEDPPVRIELMAAGTKVQEENRVTPNESTELAAAKAEQERLITSVKDLQETLEIKEVTVEEERKNLWEAETDTETQLFIKEIARVSRPAADVIKTDLNANQESKSGSELMDEETQLFGEKKQDINRSETSTVDPHWEQITSETEHADKSQKVASGEKETEKSDFPEMKIFEAESNILSKNETPQRVVAGNQGETSVSHIAERIVDSIVRSEKDGTRRMKIQLEPSLGEMEITMKETAGKLTAIIRVTNEELREALQVNAYDIEANLKNQGVNVEHIEMSSFGSMFEKGGSQHNGDNGMTDTRRQYHGGDIITEAKKEETYKPSTGIKGRINYLA